MTSLSVDLNSVCQELLRSNWIIESESENSVTLKQLGFICTIKLDSGLACEIKETTLDCSVCPEITSTSPADIAALINSYIPEQATDYRKLFISIFKYLSSDQRSSLRYLLGLKEKKALIQKKIKEFYDRINMMPSFGETTGQCGKAIAYLHYTVGTDDYFVIEKPDDALNSSLAYGLANTGNGLEYGYISIPHICNIGAELNIYWEPTPVSALLNKA